MRANYIILAVPFFVLAILVEVLLSHRKKLRTYRLHDSIANLGCGVGSQAFAAVTGAFGLYVYHQLQSHVGLLTISESSVLAWVALLLIDDFCYYLYHRGSHRVNVLWATHAVHHQSEEYNLAVALRQSWFTGLTSFVFYLPLALLGFPLAMFLTMRTINTLYQFWIHTRPIGKLGVLEWFLNTPSHHRVHHGVDPRYIDRNHAGMFIIWDRLLGTFEPEDTEPVYGTVKPLASFNPLWANFAEFARLWEMSVATTRLRDKLKLWFAPPEWRPADLGGIVQIPEVSRATQHIYGVQTSLPQTVYVITSFALTFVAAVLFLGVQQQLSGLHNAIYVAELTIALATVGGITENKPWAARTETLRLLSLCLLAGLGILPRLYAVMLLSSSVALLLGHALLTFTNNKSRSPQSSALPKLP